MKILIACEYSGTVRDACIRRGHDAWSCDTLPTESDFGPHMECDVLEVLDEGWDLMIAHPPCTYLASSGLHWNKRRPERAAKTEKALEFVEALWRAPIPRVAIENPVGCINTRLKFMPKPQYVHPYMFGDDASKKTGFWRRGLPPLQPTKQIEPRIVTTPSGRIYKRWANQYDCGRDNTPNTANRAKERSKTFPGIAEAIAEQWTIEKQI